MRTSILVLASIALGVIGAVVVPSEFMFVPILVPFAFCVALAWFVAFSSKAIQLTPVRLFAWPFVNLTGSLKPSRALKALYASAAFLAGACFTLLIRASYA